MNQHCNTAFRRVLAICAIPVFFAACSPSLSPLYRDYRVSTNPENIYPRIRESLKEAGWQEATTSAPNVVATEEKTLSFWLIYKVVASLELVPIGDEHVRVYVHPYRLFFTGARSKVPFLPPSLNRKTLSDLTLAMEERGLILIGNPIANDRKARRNRNQ